MGDLQGSFLLAHIVSCVYSPVRFHLSELLKQPPASAQCLPAHCPQPTPTAHKEEPSRNPRVVFPVLALPFPRGDPGGPCSTEFRRLLWLTPRCLFSLTSGHAHTCGLCNRKCLGLCLTRSECPSNVFHHFHEYWFYYFHDYPCCIITHTAPVHISMLTPMLFLPPRALLPLPGSANLYGSSSNLGTP